MNSLRIPLSEIAGQSSRTIHVNGIEEMARPEGAPPFGLAEFTLDGVLSPLGEDFVFHGTLSAEVERSCDRCLASTRSRQEREVSWSFEADASDEEPLLEGGEELIEEIEVYEEWDAESIPATTFAIENEQIDLGSAIWEEVVLEAPGKSLCTPDCKGLCPQCGADLNGGACGCKTDTESVHPGLAGLKDMFPDLPDTSED